MNSAAPWLALTITALTLASCSASTEDSAVEKERHLLRGDCRAQAIAVTEIQASFIRLGEKPVIKLGGRLYVPALLKPLPVYPDIFDPSAESRATIIVSGFADPNHRCPTVDYYPALFLTAIRRAD